MKAIFSVALVLVGCGLAAAAEEKWQIRSGMEMRIRDRRAESNGHLKIKKDGTNSSGR